MICPKCGRSYSEYYFKETPDGLICHNCAEKNQRREAGSGAATARKVAKTIAYTGGREGQMSSLATFFLLVGIFGLIATLIIWGITKSPITVPLGVFALFQGIALFIILEGGAEIIRLLKKQAGQPYGGWISEVKPVRTYACSACGRHVGVQSEICPGCRASFTE